MPPHFCPVIIPGDDHQARKIRLDELLLARGLAESRTQAQRLILAGQVSAGDEVLDKAGQLVPEDAEVRVQAACPMSAGAG